MSDIVTQPQETQTITQTSVESVLATQQAAAEALINSADGQSFIPSLRLKNKNSEALDGATGSIVLGKDNIVQDGFTGTGPGVQVYVGPWRYQAIRWRGAGVAPDIKSYNLTQHSVYQNGAWILDDSDLRLAGIFTPDYMTVMIGALIGDEKGTEELIKAIGQEAFDKLRSKALPDNFPSVTNNVGYSSLLYLPDYKSFAIYFISGQAKNQSSCYRDLQRFQGQAGYLGSKETTSGRKVTIPYFRVDPNTKPVWPSGVQDMFNKFLYESVDAVVDPNARPR